MTDQASVFMLDQSVGHIGRRVNMKLRVSPTLSQI